MVKWACLVCQPKLSLLCLSEQEENAIEKKHSTSIDAANIAKRMNAKKLIITHISSRYQEDAIKLLQEAKKIFPNTVLAEDLLKIQIN